MNVKNLVLAMGLAAGLAACASGPRQAARQPPAVTPTEQFSVHLDQAPEQIALAIHRRGLSPNQQSALSDFVGRWRDNGGGVVTVSAPVGSGDPALSRRAGDATLSFLRRLGVPAESVRLAGYDAKGAANAPVLASFARYAAVGPNCTGHWDNLTSTGSNQPSTHFGCAETANFAAMIANPRDLAAPAASDPADNSRREVVLGKYRQGAVTSAAHDDQASGQVSQQ